MIDPALLPVAAIAETGNTIPAPPRQQGTPDVDLLSVNAWVGDLHRTLVRESNVVGTQRALIEAINAVREALLQVDQQLTALRASFDALAYMPGTVSGTYTASELAAAYDKLNAIIAALRTP